SVASIFPGAPSPRHPPMLPGPEVLQLLVPCHVFLRGCGGQDGLTANEQSKHQACALPRTASIPQNLLPLRRHDLLTLPVHPLLIAEDPLVEEGPRPDAPLKEDIHL